ncbi:MAG: hypothetical protein ACREF7_02840, partial [Candidatus Saccharimonadales bacterium]
ALGLFGAALLATTIPASAHSITSIKVHCNGKTPNVAVTISGWYVPSHVEVTNLAGTVITEYPTTQANETAHIPLSNLAGNGSYFAGQEGYPTDPAPVEFTVACATTTPSPTTTATTTTSPSPSPTATSTPSPTPTPTATPTTSPTPTTTPTPTPTPKVVLPGTGTASGGTGGGPSPLLLGLAVLLLIAIGSGLLLAKSKTRKSA